MPGTAGWAAFPAACGNGWALAQALMGNPKLVILDQPVSALDPQGRYEVIKIMERLRGTTTIFYVDPHPAGCRARGGPGRDRPGRHDRPAGLAERDRARQSQRPHRAKSKGTTKWWCTALRKSPIVKGIEVSTRQRHTAAEAAGSPSRCRTLTRLAGRSRR